MVKWEQGQSWQEIANSYLRYLQGLGCRSQKIIVVFDGYSRSPKDHDHIRRTKKSCCDLQIRPDLIHWTPRAKFLDNTHNKSELIHLLSSTFRKLHITVEQCDNDADTSSVREALDAARDGSVEVSNICVHILLSSAMITLKRRVFTLYNNLTMVICFCVVQHTCIPCSIFRCKQKTQMCW